MNNSLKQLLEAAKSVIILLPTKPYFDQVAAGLSLFLSIRDQKEAVVMCPTPMTVEFNRLIGVNKVTQELGNKNLVIEFSDYQASNIERVSYDIIDGKFRLTVIPKPDVSAPNREQLELNYSGVTADTVILIGGANESHFPALSTKDLADAKIVHIGTRDLEGSSSKGIISMSRTSSSVSEIISYLIAENGFPMDSDIATNLLMGIEDATKNYTDPSVGATTFEIVGQLIRAGGKRGAATPQETQSPQFQEVSTPTPQTYTQSVGDSIQSTPKPSVQTQGQTQVANDEVNVNEPPTDWLKPKIYKGTTVN